MSDAPQPPPKSSLVFYQTEDGRTRIQCRFEQETIWLTQKLMADLFQKDVRTVNEHLRNIFAEGELREESVIRKFRITAADGKSYETQHYDALAEQEYERFAARRREAIEAEAEGDLLKSLEDVAKKRPKKRQPPAP